MIGLREFGVLRAIHLHNQARGGRIEISDVVADWFLSVELYAEDLLSTQSSPQTLLRIS